MVREGATLRTSATRMKEEESLTCAHMLLVELRAVTTSVAFTAQFVRTIAE